jgi:hypothetical protein
VDLGAAVRLLRAQPPTAAIGTHSTLVGILVIVLERDLGASGRGPASASCASERRRMIAGTLQRSEGAARDAQGRCRIHWGWQSQYRCGGSEPSPGARRGASGVR